MLCTPSTHPSHLHRVPELCLHMRLVLKQESHVLYDGPQTGLMSGEPMIQVQQFRHREVQQLLVLFSQCGHLLLPGDQQLSCVTHLCMWG